MTNNKELISKIMSEVKFKNSNVDQDKLRRELNLYLSNNLNITKHQFIDYIDIIDVDGLYVDVTFALGIKDNCLFINVS